MLIAFLLTRVKSSLPLDESGHLEKAALAISFFHSELNVWVDAA